MKFLVCALFYGDFPELAERCARSMAQLRATGRVDLRIGLNAVSPRSRAVIDAILPGVDAIAADPQIYKNPMLRRLALDYAGDATHLMWFDDDSCLQDRLNVDRWLTLVAQRAAQTGGTTGSLYSYELNDLEREWIRRQPWYTGKDLSQPVLFNTGGWFVVPLSLLRRWDFPPPEPRHNGGDVALGELCRQQGLAVLGVQGGVAINADASLRESSAPRRGLSELPFDLPARLTQEQTP